MDDRASDRLSAARQPRGHALGGQARGIRGETEQLQEAFALLLAEAALLLVEAVLLRGASHQFLAAHHEFR